MKRRLTGWNTQYGLIIQDVDTLKCLKLFKHIEAWSRFWQRDILVASGSIRITTSRCVNIFASFEDKRSKTRFRGKD
jgi:hypothetical protein